MNRTRKVAIAIGKALAMTTFIALILSAFYLVLMVACHEADARVEMMMLIH